MYKKYIYQLENNEANVLDEIIRIYKIPFEIFQDEDFLISDYFYDCESDEPLDLISGINDIIEYINCDNRELFDVEIEEDDKQCFFEICKELGIKEV